MRAMILVAMSLSLNVSQAAEPVAEAAEAAEVAMTKAEKKAEKKAAKARRKAEKKAALTRASDLDGDGLTGAADACPTEPENQNGWKDDDGCPDQLATVLLVARLGRAPASGATATITGDHERVVEVSGPTAIQIPPEGSIEVALDYDGCWAATTSLTLQDGPNIIDVPLRKVGECSDEVASADAR